MSTCLRILIVDDHFLVRIGLQTSLALSPEVCMVRDASTAAQALAIYERERPDIVVMDVWLPDMDGVRAASLLLGQHPEAKVILISTLDAVEDVYRAFEAGVRAYLLKSSLSDELLRAIRLVQAGDQYLSIEIARCLAPCTPDIDSTLARRQVQQLALRLLQAHSHG